MEFNAVSEAVGLLEKANANLETELLSPDDARALLAEYARAVKLASFGVAELSCKVDDATEIARTTGTSVGKARQTVETARALNEADEVSAALAGGDISLDQASEIARAEQARPWSAAELLAVAQNESFQVLRERSRKIKLEAEQLKGDLGSRQRQARKARSFNDELGMVNINLTFEPHVGTPIVNRAEAEAARLYKKAKKDGRQEPFERHLADAYAALLSGNGKGRAKRPELVVLVSYEVAKRGWMDVREGEVCKIPGVGPVPPEVAREIAKDAFLTGVLYDGKDLRNLRRWTRNTPVEVRLALELGEPPNFDGVRCVDCGKRFNPQSDHVEPHVAYGPASTKNLEWRCWSCHQVKTERDARPASSLRCRRTKNRPTRSGGRRRMSGGRPDEALRGQMEGWRQARLPTMRRSGC